MQRESSREALVGTMSGSSLRCSGCGFENAPGIKFCGECGCRLTVSSSAQPDPRAYTPKHLAEKILTSRAALEGERKQVTVFFADVKGSMELAEQVDPEEWHRILERFFAILAEGVHRFEGTVNQYTGDGIMALFGAPIAHEDHAQRACWAALHLRDTLREYAEELKRTRGIAFAVRTGLNSGEVVVGRIGDDLRMDYTAQGHVVGLAQRMEQLAGADRVYLTEHTVALVAGYFRLRDLGVFTVKGLREPLRVHELEGVGAHRTRLDVSRARRFMLSAETTCLTLLAEAYLGAGTLEQAREVADRAVAVARARSHVIWEIRALCVRARALLATGGVREAAEVTASLDRAAALVQSTGARALEPEVRIERARLAGATGDEAGRRRELGEAHRLFVEMGVTTRAEQVARELEGT